jgi:hypothetical protein
MTSLLKYGAGVLAEPLHQVLMQIRDTEDIPTDWKKGVIAKLFKKGRTADCNNWPSTFELHPDKSSEMNSMVSEQVGHVLT